MRLCLVAVGQRLPAWADAACDEFAKRLPPELGFAIKACKAEPRDGRSAGQLMAAEAKRIEAALPGGARRVVLDERGTGVTTQQLAARLLAWMADGRDVALVIGGPDGLAPSIKERADETLRLSELTLPHALARVLLCEAIYRAWTVTASHPYHRE